MIRSMTGYGTAETMTEDWTLRVEVRSLNHGELKVSPRLPETLRLKESELTGVVQKHVARGQIYVTVDCDVEEGAVEMMVDKEKLRGYLQAATRVVGAENVPLQAEAGSLLNLPDVITSESVPLELREELWPEVLKATGLALEDMVQMREEEGKNLARQMKDIAARMRHATNEIAGGLDQCLTSYQDRLVERVGELMEHQDVEPDPEVLAREVAKMAERSDVSEEITRMLSHLDQFESVIENNDTAVGKKLDFLVQEMHREANTMSAKLPSNEMVQMAVEIKSDVQKLREQVRNIE
jgi:uncharacterized protein (TIGR00255 family)